jgi:hypothetical protein
MMTRMIARGFRCPLFVPSLVMREKRSVALPAECIAGFVSLIDYFSQAGSQMAEQFNE